MSDIELAVRGAKQIEAFLAGQFGAVGRGLHEKLTSVEGRIPGDLQKKIRFVASVRNAVVHEVGDNRMRNPVAFEATVTQILHGLNELSNRRPPAAAVGTGKVHPSGKSSGGVMRVICDKAVAPWIFLLGCAIGLMIGAGNQMGVGLSVLLALLLGGIAAAFSRVVLLVMVLGVIAFSLLHLMSRLLAA